jgi:hypothetical protein
MIFSVACFLGYFWSTYIVPETGNVSLEEMDAVFGSSAAAEDSQLKHEVRHCKPFACRSYQILFSFGFLWF